MDTERFELTDEEVGNLEWTETPAGNYSADFSFIDDYTKEIKVILKAQVAKVLSLLEPVELEALAFNQDEILGLIPAQAILDFNRAKEVLEKVTQATIRKNQKGQLFRVKEEKDGSSIIRAN